MPRYYPPRRFFKTTEIKLMRQLADEGKSQAYVGKILGRSAQCIGTASIRYGIQFQGKCGRPRHPDRAAQLARHAETNRQWRARQGAKTRPRPIRFDDPRVMIDPLTKS